MNKYYTYLLIAIQFVQFSCNTNNFELLDSSNTNIDFSNDLNENDNASILDYLYFYNGGGVGLGDFNQDGLLDIYFTANQKSNKLYINLGDFKFKDITELAGVSGHSDWNTGVTIGDFNNDGLDDIYISAVVGILGFQGHNELFINNGDLTFTERSKEFGLDFKTFGTNTALLDYDLDGDLDLYLLNHAIHNQLSYGKASNRNKRSEWGDKLLENRSGHFVDVSEKAGIYGSPNGYGLNVVVADFNNDNYPDLYVNNDFYEDDYYYVNNQDGTFSDNLKKYFGHTSKFSMGSDVVDLNNDGYMDLITLDMLPDDETILKNSATDDTFELINLRVNRLGYHYQYARNMLQINQKGNGFSEVALQYGISATDWSWGSIFSDFNNDGVVDLFVSNGILRRPNDLDYINFISNDQVKSKLNKTNLIDNEALSMMPKGVVKNKVFQGTETGFKEQTNHWLKEDKPSISNGIAVGDLNNDGLLDVVTNNINQKASIYKNTLETENNYLRIELKYLEENWSGIGSKAYLYCNGKLQYKELYQVKGFESTSEKLLHFGINSAKSIDSLIIQWPNNSKTIYKDLKINQKNLLSYQQEYSVTSTSNKLQTQPLFKKINPIKLGVKDRHVENSINDFDLQKLLPYKLTDRGPKLAVGDFNNDTKPDLIIGSSNRNPIQSYSTVDSLLKSTPLTVKIDDISEQTSISIIDIDNDQKNDLIISNGGGFFKNESVANKDIIVCSKNYEDTFLKNTNFITTADFNNDGLLDLFICEGPTISKFGEKINANIVYQNNNGFEITNQNEMVFEGIPQDAISTDFNNDGQLDLIVVGEWMSPVFLKNNLGSFTDVSDRYLPNLKGLWRTILPYDIDNDGDLDYMLGNWGLNSKFKASSESPLKMLINDFDKNGSTEPIVCISKNGDYYAIESLDNLTKALVLLFKDKFNSYRDYSGKSIDEMISKTLYNESKILEVNELASGYLLNEHETFKFVPFESSMQYAPINAFISEDFNHDGINDLIAAGNYFGVPSYQGKLDGFAGVMISNGTINSGIDLGLDFMNKQISDLKTIKIANKSYLLVAINNKPIQAYEY